MRILVGGKRNLYKFNLMFLWVKLCVSRFSIHQSTPHSVFLLCCHNNVEWACKCLFWKKDETIANTRKTVMSATTAKSLQSCPTLCDPIDGSPPGSPVPGILKARTPEWVTISFSNAWKWKVKVKSLSRVRPSVTPWTAALQAPPSMGFSRQEYWSGVPLPSLEWKIALANYIFSQAFVCILCLGFCKGGVRSLVPLSSLLG